MSATGMLDTAFVFCVFHIMVCVVLIVLPSKGGLVRLGWGVFGLMFAGYALLESTLPFQPWFSMFMAVFSIFCIYRGAGLIRE